ncbi:biotin-dependent carboxyltransferase family protein [Sporolactobacillus kofuensis]|uniref:Biotin-dependent carboxyltransferase family protein n=1 Tax=Sporolactobacillus kofuensis TaxID=269672 RepID=A0ABW1WG47_9BACL|nr:biotin-dependent carboxyltransferase family protein [Sporolactobacillus kofuensis]MCO7175149.1 biotin-dependent carboxyltransferase family protein [Sporolactobacillus kofuensis]
MTLTLLQKGFASSVQDLGRFGFQRYGIIVGGVMDPPSAKLANWLVGNLESAALIEYSFIGPSVLFTEDTLFALTGADSHPNLDGREIGTGRPCLARKGEILTVGGLVSGSRGYLAVAGGIDTPEWFGSRSTYERAGQGGFKGRLLQDQDQLPIGKPSELATRILKEMSHSGATTTQWFFSFRRTYRGTKTIRIIPDMLWNRFSEDSRHAFLSTDYQITASSDRMGYRLEGKKLELDQPLELYSEAVTNGSIQVPRSGQPIILLTDHQSTGGYPRIAQVASVDLPVLAQLAPNSKLHFLQISVEEAETLLVNHWKDLDWLRRKVQAQLVSILH